MTENKRFKVAVYKDNSVKLVDTLYAPLMRIKFNNKEDAVSYQDALFYQCDLMNALYDENKELKEENKQLKISLSTFVKKSKRLQNILDKLGYKYIGDLK